jgi:hypothetical protein
MIKVIDSFKQAVTEAWNYDPDEKYLTRKELETAIRAFVLILGRKVLSHGEQNELIRHYEALRDTKKENTND